MALDTYDGLKAAVAGTLKRTDLAASVPDFITLAEAQMVRRFVTRAKDGLPLPRRLVTRDTATIPAGSEYIELPDSFLGPRALTLGGVDLDFLELESFRVEKMRNCGTRPRVYTLVGEDFQIFPPADQDYSAELVLLTRPAKLSADNPTNWVLADHPDAYLYGALEQSAPYLREDARIAMWASLFSAAVDDICRADPLPVNHARLRVDPALLRPGAFPFNITNGCNE
jgi:hypothetical protein